MTREQTIAALKKLDLDPSKSMGQNFLVDERTASGIVRRLDLHPEDTIIEIGPGLGALTEHLEGKCRQLILVEKDRRLAGYLQDIYGKRDDVDVVLAGGEEIDLRPFFKEQPVKVVGALPYSMGSDIIANVLRNPTPVSRAVFTLQKEVCERICAVPGTKSYGKMTVRIQARWVVSSAGELEAELFQPQPRVVSAIIEMVPRERDQLPVFDERVLDRMVRHGFSQRRKQLRKLLPEHPMPWPEMAESLGVKETCRGEELTLEKWVDLTRLYDDHPLKDNPQEGDELFDVVDEKDEVVRQEKRAIVHAEDLRHRAVHLFVFNKHGELFLQKRSHLKDVHPSTWDSSAAGHLDAGEGYREAAVREIEEELGISDSEGLREVARLPASEMTGWEFVVLYAMEHRGKLRYPCSEIETGAYFPTDLIREWIERRPEDFASGFIECFRTYEEELP